MEADLLLINRVRSTQPGVLYIDKKTRQRPRDITPSLRLRSRGCLPKVQGRQPRAWVATLGLHGAPEQPPEGRTLGPHHKDQAASQGFGAALTHTSILQFRLSSSSFLFEQLKRHHAPYFKGILPLITIKPSKT